MKNFDQVIKLLKEYKEQHGDCLVPRSYTTKNGVRLGSIVYTIRQGSRKTNANEKAILNDLGFVWKVRENYIPFDEVIKLLKEYKKQYGDCLVPQSYTTENGVRLGAIVNRIRQGSRKTNVDEKAMLNDLGFVWKVRESYLSFDEVIKLLKKYKEQYGNCLVPISYTTKDGIRLGWIMYHIRKGSRKTNVDEKAMLDSLGFVWKERHHSFDEVIKLLKEYKEQYGDCLVPFSYTTKDGVNLGWIVYTIRQGSRKTNANEKAILNDLGFVWKVRENYIPFDEVIKLLKEYKKQYGDCLVPQSYTTENGVNLGRIVCNIRHGSRKTSTDEKAILNSLDFVWKVRKRRRNK